MSDKLKPCPFCGGKAHVERMGTSRVSMQIECGDCGAGVETGETWIDEHSMWNKRPTHDRMVEEIAELKSDKLDLIQMLTMAIDNPSGILLPEGKAVKKMSVELLARLNQEGGE